MPGILAVVHWCPLLLTVTVCMQHVALLQGIIYTSPLYFLKLIYTSPLYFLKLRSSRFVVSGLSGRRPALQLLHTAVHRGVGRGLKVRGKKWRAQRRENLINIHDFVLENGSIRACAAEQRSILTQLGPISCRKALTRRYCYWFLYYR